MASGAILVAVLALIIEAALAGVQRAVVSPGLRAPSGRTRPPPEPDTKLPHTPKADDRPAPEMAGVNPS